MRQRRWLELVKDYDCEILYHPGKANVVADALSRKVAHSTVLITKHAPLLRDFERAEIAVSIGEVTSQLAQLSVQPTLRQRIIVAQLNDLYLVEKHRLVEEGQGEDFSISSDDDLTFEERLCVLEDSAVKTELLTETHSSPFIMHPGSEGTETEANRFIVALECARLWKSVLMDFITGLPMTLKGYIVIWVVVDRLMKSAYFVPRKSTYIVSKWGQLYMTEIVRLDGVPVSIVSDRDARFTSKFWKGLQLALGTRSPICWGEVGEQTLLGPELVQTTNAAIQKIRARMLTTQSRQKSYADVRCKDLEFDVGDKVFLKVAPMKRVLRFEKKGKLSPRFVRPFEILERIGPIAYRLVLPPSFSAVYDVLHVSMLRRYVADPTHVVDFEPL
ncbi:pol protein [Cucumis melo var. makuwa]|uniref:Pol protein n=1 Tax=Cucumis melo var. makuwa TaxID=1194695 RepID=A0A5D3CUE2_CUCMM|nr:pol protein [Cucumis melo var. makuwa]TYK13829.1 pol protein [Cucumis melo var. makuwa]